MGIDSSRIVIDVDPSMTAEPIFISKSIYYINAVRVINTYQKPNLSLQKRIHWAFRVIAISYVIYYSHPW